MYNVHIFSWVCSIYDIVEFLSVHKYCINNLPYNPHPPPSLSLASYCIGSPFHLF